MSIPSIIATLDKLYTLHEQFYRLSKEKTTLLQGDDTTALQPLLVKERKYIQAITQIEQKRQQLVEEWLSSQELSNEEPTLTTLLTYVKGEENELLQQFYDRFVPLIAEIKQQEQLNQEITRQSLQYIELSLNLLQPTMKNLNYSNQRNSASEAPKTSVFDSKA
ncbi:flagellar protein FlgN [Pontibacillus litoralis]|uniref:FlgN protein n=1 Tax=Pontibacillus litoralis JSM 072002 TaxID=1385512 RepID=A0A0A5G5E2_9BACI|nr:flagellar protein FlgN [Pontibacillus litoralis]KGX86315.1 hypothetical protein N784_05035 [Pontibacillus litoralis JSM 072002]